ncbi:hypothetical protein SK854_01005 [Lentzea sp. BCCO 10_0061]|uniref:Uncharacterized protein n=1 Tax=Lentzea sokolovensis TaxID=3095429 RepID=A0ABU4UPB6_9PSEU|nr:hypothetical protein [Lentzea sp. BCCO 10_0061]MDX8140673.1 hypothetical protein [Lentzea sp. BCCO 10_0061]
MQDTVGGQHDVLLDHRHAAARLLDQHRQAGQVELVQSGARRDHRVHLAGDQVQHRCGTVHDDTLLQHRFPLTVQAHARTVDSVA